MTVLHSMRSIQADKHSVTERLAARLVQGDLHATLFSHEQGCTSRYIAWLGKTVNGYRIVIQVEREGIEQVILDCEKPGLRSVNRLLQAESCFRLSDFVTAAVDPSDEPGN